MYDRQMYDSQLHDRQLQDDLCQDYQMHYGLRQYYLCNLCRDDLMH